MAMLEEGISTGIFKAVPHPKITVAGIIGMLNWVPEWFSPRVRSARPAGDDLAELVLSGLVPGSEGP